jgi:hypothetical protein
MRATVASLRTPLKFVIWAPVVLDFETLMSRGDVLALAVTLPFRTSPTTFLLSPRPPSFP